MTSQHRPLSTYSRALIRNLYELRRALSYRNAFTELLTIAPNVSAFPEPGASIFTYSFFALHDAMFLHVMNVLDLHTRVASFFYLHKCNTKGIEDELVKNGLSLADINILADKLKGVRDKAHFHIDKKAVFNPSEVWYDADIEVDFFNHVTETLEKVLHSMFVSEFNREIDASIYGAEDIKAIIGAVQSKGIRI
ncbi:MAG: hypothetical protein ABSF91_05095 [Bacteroidota bacterium]|jgi:hypothetical protein